MAVVAGWWSMKFADAPLALRWRYVRMVWVGANARALCWLLRLPAMTGYTLADGSGWNVIEPDGK